MRKPEQDRASAEGGVRVCIAFEPPGHLGDLQDYLGQLAPRVEVEIAPFEHLADVEDAVRSQALDTYRRSEVFLTRELPRPILVTAPRVRWIQSIYSGIDRLVSSPQEGRDLALGNVTVTNAAGVNADTVAEFVIGRLLMVWRRFDEMLDHQRDREWVPVFGRRFSGSTVGVLGLGELGREVASRARGLGLRVLALRRRVDEGATPHVDELFGGEQLLDFLGRCDAVVVTVPDTHETRKMIDARALAAMKPGSVLCNVSRGSVVDQAALIDACRSGHLGKAVLDVFDEEPLPATSPLWGLANVLVSAHCATAFDGYFEGVLELFADNLARYLRGMPMRNVVDPELGY